MGMGKNTKDSKDRYYSTANFYESAFLFTRGFELVNVDHTLDARKAFFIFIETPDREKTSYQFLYGTEEEVLVDARKFVYAIKTLKAKLYENNK